jgi:hypothetical protein
MPEVRGDSRRERDRAAALVNEIKMQAGDHFDSRPRRVVYDKELPSDRVTVADAPHTSKSFREPPWAT